MCGICKLNSVHHSCKLETSAKGETNLNLPQSQFGGILGGISKSGNLVGFKSKSGKGGNSPPMSPGSCLFMAMQNLRQSPSGMIGGTAAARMRWMLTRLIYSFYERV